MKEIAADIIQVRGSSYEIGKKTASYYLTNPILDQFRQLANASTNHIETKTLFSDYAPHLLDELHGLSDGLKMSLSDTMTLCSGFNNKKTEALGCTAFIDKNHFVRNYDFGPDLYDHCLSFIAPTNAIGSIGYNLQLIGRHDGVNEKGLAIGLHFVSNKGYKKGLAAWSAVRLALDTCDTTEQVINLFRELPHAACYNFSVGDAKGHHAVIEATPETISVRSSKTGINCVNHFQDRAFRIYNRDDITGSVNRDDFLTNQKTAYMRQNELFEMFANPSSPLFYDDYDKLFGTLHTIAYTFEKKYLITALARGAVMEVNVEDWFAGENMKCTTLKGYI
ncbi:C45 family peptidase [Terribacillus saccharophilus]|uniref:C45 family autoproteolytic acyltransferase/hydolase n=1 Tax=Terribacillus saccharophilus TaxID=361277 RepID=UPI00398213EF